MAARKLDPDEQDAGVVVPVLVGAVAVGGVLWWRHRGRDAARDESAAAVTAASDGGPPHLPGRWIYPVPRWQGRAAEISDGWGSTRAGGARGGVHRGADLMFRRRHRFELLDLFPPPGPGRPSPHTRGYFMPPGTLALAAADGEVWSAGWTPTGYSVVLSHGAPWATYYTHLASLRVGETRRGASKERVRAGQPLGVVGASPRDPRGVAHLHFEIWHGGNGHAAIDPAPLLAQMAIVDSPEVA